MVLYFTPVLGLFGLLKHYKAEQTKWIRNIEYDFVKDNLIKVGNVTVKWTNGSDAINRWNGNEAPSYELYTIYSVGTYFKALIALNVLHFAIVLILKLKISKAFRKLNFVEKIIHLIENSSIPGCVEDWDAQRGNAQEHYHRMKSNKIEGLSVIGINGAFNLLYLTPLGILVYKVHERHMFLYETIGYLDQENTAYIKSILLLSGSLFYIIVSTLLGGYFFIKYNHSHHPFAGILDFSEEIQLDEIQPIPPNPDDELPVQLMENDSESGILNFSEEIQSEENQLLHPDDGVSLQLIENIPEAGDVTICVIPPIPVVEPHQPIVAHLTEKSVPPINIQPIAASMTDTSVPSVDFQPIAALQTDISVPPVNPEPIISPLTNISVPTDNPEQISAPPPHKYVDLKSIADPLIDKPVDPE